MLVYTGKTNNIEREHKRGLYLIFLAVFFLRTPGLAAQGYHTNSIMISDLMEKVAKQTALIAGIKRGTAVQIEEWHGNTPLNRYLSNRFFRTWMDQGILLRVAAAPDSLDFKMGMMITHVYLFYDRIERKWPWSKAWVERCGGISVSLRITDMHKNALVFSEEIKSDTVDLVPAALLDELEAVEPIMDRPDRPHGHGFYAWIEPVGVALVLAAVTYLFYSIRSG